MEKHIKCWVQYFKEMCVFVSAQGIQVQHLRHKVSAQQKPKDAQSQCSRDRQARNVIFVAPL